MILPWIPQIMRNDAKPAHVGLASRYCVRKITGISGGFDDIRRFCHAVRLLLGRDTFDSDHPFLHRIILLLLKRTAAMRQSFS